ncbi:MAG: TetR/AcrR family transcriptional regulator [Bacilli bacterium]
MSNIDKRIINSKNAIKNSFIEILKLKDISKITIKEICERANVNRATFYAHYSNQYNLLENIEDELFLNIKENLNNYSFKFDGSNTIHILEKIFDYIKANENICNVLLNDKGDIDFQKKLICFIYDECFSKWVCKDSESSDYLYSFVVYGCIGIIQKWFDDGVKKSAKDLAVMTYNIINNINKI